MSYRSKSEPTRCSEATLSDEWRLGLCAPVGVKVCDGRTQRPRRADIKQVRADGKDAAWTANVGAEMRSTQHKRHRVIGGYV